MTVGMGYLIGLGSGIVAYMLVMATVRTVTHKCRRQT